MAGNDDIDRRAARVRELSGRKLQSLADEELERLIAEHSDDRRVRLLTFECLDARRDFLAAQQLATELIAEGVDDDAFLSRAAVVYAGNGDLELALQTLDRVRRQTDQMIAARVQNLERAGRVDEAEEALAGLRGDSPSTRLRRDHLKATIALRRRRFEDAERIVVEHLGQIELDRTPESELPLIIETHFLLSGIRDKMEDYDGAWDAAEEAHRLDGRRFDLQRYGDLLGGMKKIFAPGHREALVRSGHIDCEPLVILGNPRSGTTLLDQVLGMHPEVAPGGELLATTMMQSALGRITDSYLPFPSSLVDMRVPDAEALGRLYRDYTSGLQDGRRYLSNKALSMHPQLGLLALCLPRTRVINLHRHPLDNMVSCFTTNLLASGHTYVNDLQDLAAVWILRHDMQAFWADALDLPFLELRYEDLVTDQENQTRRVLDFLDLPFDESCLEFHRSERQTTTLSHRQVKQKMYTSSKERWRNYESRLAPILDRMSPWL